MFKQVESLKRWDGTQWVDVLFVEPATTGSYELLADITASTTTTQVDITGLSLTSDDEILLVSDIFNSGTSDGYTLHFNDIDGSYYYTQGMYADGSSISAFRAQYDEYTYVSNSRRSLCSSLIMATKDGYICSNHETIYDYGYSTMYMLDRFITTTLTVSSITSIKISATGTSEIGVGSRFRLYRTGRAT